MGIDEDWHRHFYAAGRYGTVTWRGVQLVKHPMDLPVFAEVIHEVMPRVIIETGTRTGGSALFFADMMEIGGVPDGRVVSVDTEPDSWKLPVDHRVLYIRGDAAAPESVDQVHVWANSRTPRMVILDSDHSAEHVYRELEAYHYLVTPGSYLIVEDSNTGGHPVESIDVTDGGPMAALDKWLPNHPEFTPDPYRERFGVTFNPNGWLRRQA